MLEGVLGKRSLNNHSLLSDARADSYLEKVTPGQVLQSEPIDRALLLLADTPGVSEAHALLQPGEHVGGSDVLVELYPGPSYVASLDLDNNGNYYTGTNRASASLALNNPLGLGDQINAHLLSSGPGLTYVHLAYQAPVGVNGLRLGFSLSNTAYQIGQEFAALQAQGTASITNLSMSYPFVRSIRNNLQGSVAWDSKSMVDQTGVPQSESDKQVSELTFGLNANHKDALGGGDGGINNAGVFLSLGNLNMDAASLALDAAPGSAQTQGSFQKLDYNINRLQSLNPLDAVFLSLQGQSANKNLASSEKFSLGGASGVRAYPQGEGSGDQGWLATLEWRHDLPGPLQGVLFYDTGAVDINHNAYLDGSNNRSIAGLGIGLNGQYGRLLFKTSVAWSTNGGDPTSVPSGSGNSPRWWAQLSFGL